MKRPLINYKDMIGPSLTIEEKNQEKLKRKLLRELGLIPIGFVLDELKYPDVLPGRFSTHYETEHDFLQDKLLALKLINNTNSIPDGLYNKIKYTLEELEPKYGEKYNHIN